MENVLLVLLTSSYHSSDNFNGEIQRILDEEKIVQSSSVSLSFFLSKIVVYSGIPQVQMPVLYSAADVLVSGHGESMGRRTSVPL